MTRWILKAIGIVAFVSTVTAAVAVHRSEPMPRASLYHLAFSHYADVAPLIVCNDLRGNCRLVAEDFTKTIPTPLPAPPLNYDAAPSIMTGEPAAAQKLSADYANAALQWMLPIIAPILAALIADLIIKVRAYFGQQTTDTQRDRIQQMAENGVNLAAHKLNVAASTGHLPTKEQLMAEAVDYVQAHGTDTLKALGMDPTDAKTVDAIKGRVATILAQKQTDSAATSA
jgi:hypothetical protein